MPGIDVSIDSYTRLFGVMGERLGDDWSPIMHNSIFAARSDGAVFIPLRLERSQVTELLALCGNVVEGLCVAAPYHSLVASVVDRLEGVAEDMDMVDTISVTADGYKVGHLVLPEAIEEALRVKWIHMDEKRALIVGEVCFASCAAQVLLKNGADVTWAAKDKSIANDMARRIDKAGYGTARVISTAETEGRYDILINATDTCGRLETNAYAFSEEQISNCESVIDAASNPVDTELLRIAEAVGARTVCGFDIKMCSAALSQAAWGFKPLKRTARMDIYSQLIDCARNSK